MQKKELDRLRKEDPFMRWEKFRVCQPRVILALTGLPNAEAVEAFF